MTISESFTCPVCGNVTVLLRDAHCILSDVRVDTLACNKCGSEWRTYSKVVEVQTEIINYPQEQSAAHQEPEAIEKTGSTE